jgi:AcrR family transcriptional regulator
MTANVRVNRQRSARALMNDQSIRQAAIDEIIRVGVDRLSLREVGIAAGLTHGATYARYEDVEEMLVDLWISKLRERLVSLIELSMDAAENPDAQSIGALFERLRVSDHADLAALEVFLLARRIPPLLEECESFVTAYLEPDGGTSEQSRAIFARTIVLFGMALSRLYSEAMFGHDSAYQNAVEKLMIDVLSSSPTKVGTLDASSLSLGTSEMDERTYLPSDDTLKMELSRSTYAVIGKSGYVRATISRIARRANCSPAAIYKAHKSKEDLVIRSFVDMIGERWMNLDDMASLLEDGYLTQLLHSEASDQYAPRRNFIMEMAFASVHHPPIREAVVNQIVKTEVVVPNLIELDGEAKERLRYTIRTITSLVVGVGWVATIAPTTKDLDFSQFTQPLQDSLREQWQPDWPDISQEIRRRGLKRSRTSLGY